MKSDLRKKILCSILAAGVLGTADFALAANSGGDEIYEGAYIGNNGTGCNNGVYVDTNENYQTIVGGYGSNTYANDNTLIVNGEMDFGYMPENPTGGIEHIICGGFSNISADRNSILLNEINFANVSGVQVYGGLIMPTGEDIEVSINYNNVEINNSVINGSYFDGYENVIAGGGVYESAYDDDYPNVVSADFNNVRINYSEFISSNGSNKSIICGGDANAQKDASASFNNVVLNYVDYNSDVNQKNAVSIYGGRALAQENASAEYNSVVLNRVNLSSYDYQLFGGGALGQSNNNSVVINDSKLKIVENGTSDIYGGYALKKSE